MYGKVCFRNREQPSSDKNLTAVSLISTVVLNKTTTVSASPSKNCKFCGTSFTYKKFNVLPRLFCSQKCSATYNNTHKTHGCRVSKLEKWLQQKLTEKYSFDIHFNKKDAINSELDIYIPHLRLAFELNGIFHYEPIYGLEQLTKIKNNDGRKFQACLEKGIELCIIDSSKQKKVTEKSSQQFLDIIVNIIDNMVGKSEFESEL